MAYDNIISRIDAQALIPLDVSSEIIKGAVAQSVAMTSFRRAAMATGQTRQPVLSALPIAYFVNGDTGLKQTTEANWENKYLTAEEIALLIPIPDAVADDAAFDIWREIQPLAEEAIGRALDAAVFFGVNKPASWPDAIVPAAVAAGNVIARGTSTAAQGGIAGDISKTIGKVEQDGYDPTVLVAGRGYRGQLRDARDLNGRPLLDTTGNVYDTPVEYALRGLWPTGASATEMVALDANEFILGVRQDITFKIFDQGVVQDAAGLIKYNLIQQDMKVMRMVIRVAFQVANAVRYDNTDNASRYPASVLTSPDA